MLIIKVMVCFLLAFRGRRLAATGYPLSEDRSRGGSGEFEAMTNQSFGNGAADPVDGEAYRARESVKASTDKEDVLEVAAYELGEVSPRETTPRSKSREESAKIPRSSGGLYSDSQSRASVVNALQLRGKAGRPPAVTFGGQDAVLWNGAAAENDAADEETSSEQRSDYGNRDEKTRYTEVYSAKRLRDGESSDELAHDESNRVTNRASIGRKIRYADEGVVNVQDEHSEKVVGETGSEERVVAAAATADTSEPSESARRNSATFPNFEAPRWRGVGFAGDATAESRISKLLVARETLHQQTTNMRPARTQHLVQKKRNSLERSSGENFPRYAFKSANLAGESRQAKRSEGPRVSSISDIGNLPRPRINPIRSRAASAYGNRQLDPPVLNLGSLDLTRALHQFGPAQLHALRGVFDRPPAVAATQNFQPIPPKEVAYVPPRIVYETKIVPAPFSRFASEQKTVDELSALIGQTPRQQLEGLNLILGKDPPQDRRDDPGKSSRHDVLVSGPTFVTPIPSYEINSGLIDDSSFHQNVRDDETISRDIPILRGPANHQPPPPAQPQPASLPAAPAPVYEPQPRPLEELEQITVEENPGSDYEQVNNDRGKSTQSAEEIELLGPNERLKDRYRDPTEPDESERYAAGYKFGYHVQDHESGNNFGHQEERNGVVTNGRYHVLLPDGRIQNVNYHVDEGGYHAKVSYQLGSAHR